MSKENEEWIDIKIKQPQIGGEYLVTWNLQDNEYPVVTSMDYDSQTKIWTDPRGTGSNMESDILYWMELPEPKQNIPLIIWNDEPINDKAIYGQCMHGENMTNCEICNSYK